MSEVSDYEHKVKLISFADLILEKERWKTQQKEATGEYGYWGGVTGEEIVDKELKRRSGVEYSVFKNFVDADGIYHESNSTIWSNQLPEDMLHGLTINGFIFNRGKDE